MVLILLSLDEVRSRAPHNSALHAKPPPPFYLRLFRLRLFRLRFFDSAFLTLFLQAKQHPFPPSRLFTLCLFGFINPAPFENFRLRTLLVRGSECLAVSGVRPSGRGSGGGEESWGWWSRGVVVIVLRVTIHVLVTRHFAAFTPPRFPTSTPTSISNHMLRK